MNAYWKSLILICTTLTVLVVYAVMPVDIGIGSFKIRKIESPLLTSLTTDTDDTLLADTATTEETRLDTLNQTILFFGDSMLEGLGKRFADYAEANGHQLHIVLWYSSTTDQWGNTKTLDHYINTIKPTFVAICLGSNELFVKDLSQRDKNIQQILSKIGSIPYVWIGPPNWKKDTGIDSLILKNVGERRYFDSQRLTLKRASDKVHPTMSAATVWMDSVAVWMNSMETAHPILMQQPDHKGKATSMKLFQPNFKGL